MSERWLITGSRDWTDRGVIREALRAVPRDGVVVHGACNQDADEPGRRPMKGADLLADEEARARGLTVEPHPAAWRRLRNKAGPTRNQEMVDAGAVLCLAFPLPGSRGTWDCVERAHAAGIHVLVWDRDEATFFPYRMAP